MPAEFQMDNPFPGARCYHAARLASTMDEARLLSADSRYGLVYADEQSAGRGRLPGRSWHGQAGASLLVTLWFPAGEFGTAPLPLVAGVALIRACLSWARAARARFEAAPLLKWPNDVLCGTQKLAGILCESSGTTVYAGVGLNCRQDGFPAGFRTEPTSIRQQTGIAADPAALLHCLVEALYAMRAEAGHWRQAYTPMLAWAGRPVTFRPGIDEEPISGILAGVDDAGSVLIDTGGAIRVFPSGELELRY